MIENEGTKRQARFTRGGAPVVDYVHTSQRCWARCHAEDETDPPRSLREHMLINHGRDWRASTDILRAGETRSKPS